MNGREWEKDTGGHNSPILQAVDPVRYGACWGARSFIQDLEMLSISVRRARVKNTHEI